MSSTHTEDPAVPQFDSTTLAIVQPTSAEIKTQAEKNSVSWRGALSPDAYLRREEHLANQALTREAGITFWVLVSTAVDPSQRKVLAGCETLRKRALVARDGKVQDVVCHGVASVFVPPEYRGKKYGFRLIQELGKRLQTWQAENSHCLFSVLCSDIGKQFYAQHGWHPHTSSHVHLPPASSEPHPPPTVDLKLLHASELSSLCAVDESLVRSKLDAHVTGQQSAPETRKPVIAIVPDVKTLEWHHAREEFVATELHGSAPHVKGALATVNGHRVWAIWTRVFLNPDKTASKDNTLHVLRVCIEDEEADAKDSKVASDHLTGLTAVLRVAQKEASNWKMQEVELWNPHPRAMQAAKEIHPQVQLVHREEESIASLKWFEDNNGEERMEIEWRENEKFAWC